MTAPSPIQPDWTTNLDLVQCRQNVRQRLDRSEMLLDEICGELLNSGSRGLTHLESNIEEVYEQLTEAVFLLKRNPQLQDEELSGMATLLQQHVTQVSLMINQAVHFYSEWLQIWNARTQGYAQNGRGLAADQRSHLSIET